MSILCRDYVNKFKPENATFEHLITNKTYFKDKFTQFLFSPKGAIYQVRFSFSFVFLLKGGIYQVGFNFLFFFLICILLSQPNFWFSSKLVCGEPAPDVQLQAIPFQHKRFFRCSVKTFLCGRFFYISTNNPLNHHCPRFHQLDDQHDPNKPNLLITTIVISDRPSGYQP